VHLFLHIQKIEKEVFDTKKSTALWCWEEPVFSFGISDLILQNTAVWRLTDDDFLFTIQN